MMTSDLTKEGLRQWLQGVLKRMRSDLSADVLTFFLYDKETDQFDFPVGEGLIDKETFEDPRALPRRGRAARKIIKEKAPLFAENAESHPQIKGAFIYREDIKASVGYPLTYGNEVFGVLFVGFRRLISFDRSRQSSMRKVIQKEAKSISGRIDFRNLREEGCFSLGDDSDIYQPMADLFSTAMDRPVAIWLLDLKMQTIAIKASTGLPPRYLTEANASFGDGDIISWTIENGKLKIVNQITVDQNYIYRNHLVKAKLKSSITYPIHVRNQTLGAIEIFAFKENGFSDYKPGQYKHNVLRCLSDMTGFIIEQEIRSHESKKFLELANTISSSFDFNKVINEITKTASELTFSHSSAIDLIDDQSSMIDISDAFSCSFQCDCNLCHNKNLTQYIIRGKDPLILNKIGDTSQIKDNAIANQVQEIMRAKGIKSLIAVPVDTKDEHLGVLYACGLRKSQFNDYHVDLLRNLAYQLSIIIGRSHYILRATQEIDNAISDLSKKKQILDAFCKDIKTKLGFEYVTISMKRFDENIIEVITGAGFGKEWSGLSKHSLFEIEDDGTGDQSESPIKKPELLRDIQADIVLSNPLRTEIISGWDERFEQWIYKEFKHDKIVRITTPIVLLLDQNGSVVENWPDTFRWKKVQDTVKPDGGQHTVLELTTPGSAEKRKDQFETFVVGTVGAGYRIGTKSRIEPEEAFNLNRLIAASIPEIRKTLLHNVLQKIVERARQIISADSASLHFHQTPGGKGYVYEVCAGEIGLSFLKNCSPRKNGLGQKAIKDQELKFISLGSKNQDDIKYLSKEKKAYGIKAEAVFPLKVEDRCGVLYIYFYRDRMLTNNEKDWLNFFAGKAVAAIQQATTYTKLHEQAMKLAKLNEISRSLTEKTTLEENLLPFITNSTRMLLAADVVVIYEYDMLLEQFKTDPQVSGRLYKKIDGKSPVTSESTPMLLVDGKNNKEKNVYEPDVRKNPIFFNKRRKINSNKLLFIEREKIKSAASILLMAYEEIVGIMFVNYRQTHFFSDNEKEFIDTIASSAALAIKNQRSLQDRQDELMAMAHDFTGSLGPIVTALDRVRRKYDDNLSFHVKKCIDYAISFAQNLSIISLSTYRWLSHQAGLPVSNHMEHFNTQVEIEKLTNLLQLAKDRGDLKFKIKKDKDFPKILINKDIITVVLYGLLENAVKYADRDTIVVITLNYEKNEQRLKIRIKSTGEPIDPGESKKIFERFERSKVLRQPKEGTGIGLWAMRKLTRAVGGDLYLDKAKLPKTAEFIVEIPKISE